MSERKNFDDFFDKAVAAERAAAKGVVEAARKAEASKGTQRRFLQSN